MRENRNHPWPWNREKTAEGTGCEEDKGQRSQMGVGRPSEVGAAGRPAASGWGATWGKGVSRIQKVLGMPERGFL